MENKVGKIIVIVAPSGTGKSTIMSFIHKSFPEIQESISCTTRSPREGEIDGKHYFFLDVQNFKEKIKGNEFLEWAQVHSNYYGTTKTFVDEQISKGIDLIFDIDVQGADSFKDHFQGKENIIFIEPPSVDSLKERLTGRGTDSAEIINERLSNAVKELDKKNDYDFLMVNDDLAQAEVDIKKIILNILKG